MLLGQRLEYHCTICYRWYSARLLGLFNHNFIRQNYDIGIYKSFKKGRHCNCAAEEPWTLPFRSSTIYVLT
jgi:hypothetical protein